MFEAAFFGVPSVVAIKKPVEDALVHEVTGLAIERPNPHLLADAIDRLLLDSTLRAALGSQAKDWANRLFSIESSAYLPVSYTHLDVYKRQTTFFKLW